jgi:hypothetical protein
VQVNVGPADGALSLSAVKYTCCAEYDSRISGLGLVNDPALVKRPIIYAGGILSNRSKAICQTLSRPACPPTRLPRTAWGGGQGCSDEAHVCPFRRASASASTRFNEEVGVEALGVI